MARTGGSNTKNPQNRRSTRPAMRFPKNNSQLFHVEKAVVTTRDAVNTILDFPLRSGKSREVTFHLRHTLKTRAMGHHILASQKLFPDSLSLALRFKCLSSTSKVILERNASSKSRIKTSVSKLSNSFNNTSLHIRFGYGSIWYAVALPQSWLNCGM